MALPPLNHDVRVEICRLLPARDLARVAAVSREWRDASTAGGPWRERFTDRWTADRVEKRHPLDAYREEHLAERATLSAERSENRGVQAREAALLGGLAAFSTGVAAGGLYMIRAMNRDLGCVVGLDLQQLKLVAACGYKLGASLITPQLARILSLGVGACTGGLSALMIPGALTTAGELRTHFQAGRALAQVEREHQAQLDWI
jgi:hypothetical protein